MVEMKEEDIERSPIVRKILNIYLKKPATKSITNLNKEEIKTIPKLETINNDAAMIPKNQLK